MLARILLLCLLITGTLVSTPRSATSGTATPSESTVQNVTAECSRTGRRPPSGILGISDPHADDDEVIRLIAATGVKYVRAEIYWSRVERVPGGDYDWSSYDRMIAAYNRNDIKVSAILTYVPPRLQGDWREMDQHFAAFARAAVERYSKMGVHLWEVFNEPNLPGYGWLNRDAQVRNGLRTYAMLLARANQAVRDLDPKGFVILGGIASDQHRGLSLETTLDILYGLGAGKCYDVFAFHPYGYQNKFDEARRRVDQALDAHGEKGLPIWFNEYGWTDQSAMDMRVNSSKRDNPMLAALSQMDNADALFWFAGKDYSSNFGTPTFGLASFYLNRRPSFDTFRYFVNGR